VVPDAADPLDAVSDVTLVVDGSGDVQIASGRAESVFGRRREALAGRAIDELLVTSAESKPAADAQPVDGDGASRRDTDADGFSWTRYLDDPEPVSITDGLDLYARRTDDTTSLVRLGLTPVAHEGGVSVVATAVDLSRERTRTARLHRQTETLASLHHATQELLTKTDNENAAETAVEYIDDVVGFSIAAIWLYDEERDALEPVAWTDAAGDLFDTHPTYAADDEALSWEAFESGEPRYVPDVHDEPDRYNAETPIRSELIVPLGRYGVLNVGSTEPNALDADDRTIARLWGASVTMVFVRIERERQLREREADIARERDRLEEFAGLVSHDLRTPLNVAQGHLEMVRAETDNEKLETAAAALDRMEALIADLLALARHGEAVDDGEPVSLSTLVEEVGVTVGMDTAQLTVADATALADRSRLAQLFENLLGNARRHAGDDVRVTVGVLDDGEGVYVADDGPGIDAERRDAVFEAGHTSVADGTGFGLKIVSEIAEAHGWSVDLVESDEGGARFEFRGVELVRE
jgi:two-component system OmpR family sensor kinase